MVKLGLVKMKCLATSKSITVRCTPDGKRWVFVNKRAEELYKTLYENASEEFQAILDNLDASDIVYNITVKPQSGG